MGGMGDGGWGRYTTDAPPLGGLGGPNYTLSMHLREGLGVGGGGRVGDICLCIFRCTFLHPPQFKHHESLARMKHAFWKTTCWLGVPEHMNNGSP